MTYSVYREHIEEDFVGYESLTKDRYDFKLPNRDEYCYVVWKNGDSYKINTHYFIGVDRIKSGVKPIYVEPKMNFGDENDNIQEIDYLKMLFTCLKHTDVANNIGKTVLIKWDEPTIEIKQKEDVLTPFIIMDFLNVVRSIVKKGLKRSYYRTSETLNGRIKGKLLVKQTMQMHLKKGDVLHNVCSFDEFGVDNDENRLLKKAIEFIKSYMSSSPLMKETHAVSNIISFVSPAFQSVSSDIEVEDIKQMKSNTLFKEYDKGIRLAKMILKRFSYNISNTVKQKIPTPPFWIDMPILFELYVLSMLRDSFQDAVHYHATTNGNELDFLLKGEKDNWVIDSKYIPKWNWGVVHDNVRQVSGYARLKKVYKILGVEYPAEIKCLIIYPDIDYGVTSLNDVDFTCKENELKAYHGIYKLGVKIPIIK